MVARIGAPRRSSDGAQRWARPLSGVNDANDTAGKIGDVIIGQDGKASFVVLSVGSFLGVGDRLVVLPYDQLRTTGGKVVLPGAAEDALKALPECKHTSR